MKREFRIVDYLPIIAMLFCVAIAVHYAGIIYDAHEPIAKGFVGLFFLVLFYRTYISPRSNINHEPTRYLFAFPVGFKYIGIGVLSVALSFWALNQTLEMVFYLAKIIQR